MRKVRIGNVMTGIVFAAAAVCMTACGKKTEENKEVPSVTVTAAVTEEAQNPEKNEAEESDVKKYPEYIINEEATHQTWEGFGTSGAWWSQYVGGWDQPYGNDTVPVREKIASLLFSKEEGIGLTIYRYNLGAGSRDSGNCDIGDINRRASSFESAPGVYDWSKDANAVWFLKEAVECGAEEIVLFCNSPLERLTINGKAHMTGKGESNLAPENYGAFADYVYDVAEHMLEEGIPVRFLSPINEPQWDWLNGQEGCHYEPKEVAAVLRVFVEKLQEREALLNAGVEISAPESGEWGGRTKEYNQAILKDEVLGSYFTSMDNHSYWSDAASKKTYKAWQTLNYPDLKLRTSEWCEMVNGKDYTMDSAFNMADVIYEDMTILEVVSWQNWVAVADGDYRDGLMYVNKEKKAFRPAKRLWGYGNYTRYIRPGYVRVEIESEEKDLTALRPVAFTGVNEDGKKELVVVLINRGEETTFTLTGMTQNYTAYSVHTTNEERDLEETASGTMNGDVTVTIEGASMVTIVLSAEN